MFARISTYELESERAEEATVAFREAIKRIRGLDGLERALLLIHRDRDRAVTVTFWDSLAAMEASRVPASRARTEAARAVDSGITSTEEYDVTIDEAGLTVGETSFPTAF